MLTEKKMKIIADNKIPFLEGVFEPFVDVEYVQGNQIDNEVVRDADVLIIRTRTICNKKLLEGSSIKFIATATIGYDHIDTDYCSKNGIKWVNAPGCNASAVQQWFATALLNFAQQKQIDLQKRTLGVIGVGNVGKKVVEFAENVGMYVLLNDPPREEKEGSCIFRSIQAIQQECDIITFHVPLISRGKYKTHHLFNNSFASKLRSQSIIINSSRGEVINETDLLASRRKSITTGLLLDVWEREPDISEELLELSDISTPHIAGYSIEGKARGTAAVVQQVAAFLDLPLDNWLPEVLTSSALFNARINCENKTLQEILCEAMNKTYSVMEDSHALKSNMKGFESLRSNYLYRHEPCAWELELEHGSNEIIEALQQLGFSIKS